jgi:hypothetical protein
MGDVGKEQVKEIRALIGIIRAFIRIKIVHLWDFGQMVFGMRSLIRSFAPGYVL